MNSVLKTVLAASFVLSAAAMAQPASRAADTRAVQAVLAQYKAAIERLDAKGTERLFASDSQIFETGGSEGTYANYLVHHLGPELAAFEPFKFSETEVGRVLGLTEMGEIKVQLAQEAAADAAATASRATTPPASPVPPAAQPVAATATAGPATDAAPATGARRDEMSVTLAIGEAAEIKVKADKGARIGFDWSVSGGHVKYDTHADTPGISYHGYGKGKESTGERGELVAAFDGSHGWFWRNRSGGPVTLVVRTNGAYSDIRRVV